MCQNFRLVRRQVQFRPTIQQHLYATGGCFQEYVDPKLAECRLRQSGMTKWVNMHAGAHFWLVQPGVEPYWPEIVETQMDG